MLDAIKYYLKINLKMLYIFTGSNFYTSSTFELMNSFLLFSSIKVFSYIPFFIISLFVHIILLSLVKTNLFGYTFNYTVFTLINKVNNSVFFIYFFLVVILINYCSINMIYCDVQTTISIDNNNITLSGDIFEKIASQFGPAAVFTTSARIAAGLVSKTNLSILPKTGIIGSIAAGFTMGFKIIKSTAKANNTLNTSNSNYSLQIDNCKIHTNGTEELVADVITTEKDISILKMWINKFGPIDTNMSIKETTTSNSTNLSCETVNSSQIIEELKNSNPNWLDDFFINSPSEPLNSNLLSYLLEMLNNLLILQYLISYLTIMVIIIFTCTIITNKNINLENLKNYPLGNYIYLGLTKYISVWRETANFWILFILISLLCFSLVSAYGIYQIISNLN